MISEIVDLLSGQTCSSLADDERRRMLEDKLSEAVDEERGLLERLNVAERDARGWQYDHEDLSGKLDDCIGALEDLARDLDNKASTLDESDEMRLWLKRQAREARRTAKDARP